MGGRGTFSSAILAAAAIALAAPAAAQFSDSYSFIKAVRDADGTKVMTYLNKPGQPALDTRDPATGESALHIVVKRHDETWLAFLLSRGARTDQRDNAGDTPLLTAAQLGDSDSARLLVEAGAGVNTSNPRGETALILAVQHRDLPTIRLLVANGADPRKTDTIAGKSARDYAAEDPRATGIVKLLDEAKPKTTSVMGPVRH